MAGRVELHARPMKSNYQTAKAMGQSSFDIFKEKNTIRNLPTGIGLPIALT